MGKLIATGGSGVKESACNAGDPGSIPGLERSPGEGKGYPPQYSCLENSIERSLAGYSPWDHKELDTTEQQTYPKGLENYMSYTFKSLKSFRAIIKVQFLV